MSINVATFSSGPVGTNGYLVTSPETKTALLVDTPHGVTPLIERALADSGATLELVVITHTHWDHIGDSAAALETLGVPIAAHPLAAVDMADPAAMRSVPREPVPPAKVERLIGEGDTVTLGDTAFEVWHLPGHHPAHIVLVSREARIVLGGDVLFAGGYGRIDLPGADPAAMKESLARLGTLPDGTTVYPGHGQPTTIGAERANGILPRT